MLSAVNNSVKRKKRLKSHGEVETFSHFRMLHYKERVYAYKGESNI